MVYLISFIPIFINQLFLNYLLKISSENIALFYFLVLTSIILTVTITIVMLSYTFKQH